jgi:capsular exopolysaccharide synthesis family protein
MERLQAAIEKARERRLMESPKADVKQKAKETVTARPAVIPSGAWEQLPMLKTSERKLTRLRVFTAQKSREAVYFDKLRTKIMQQCSDNGWKRVLITSPTAGCGKTTTAANIAASFSRQRDRRLIVHEMDMRRPGMARMFGHSGYAGFASVLEGSAAYEDVGVRFAENVVLSMNQGPHPTPSKLILQDTTPRILDEIDARYEPDLTIIDSPPLLAADDTLALLKMVDCALLIVAAEQTTTKEVDNCEKEVAELTNVLGIVLNKCNYLEEDYGYGYSV